MLGPERHRLVIETQTRPAGVDDDDLALIERNREGMTFHWILMAILYVACWVYFGLATFRRGHYWLFWIGFIFPFLWIIGGFHSPDRTRRRRGIGREIAQATSQTDHAERMDVGIQPWVVT